MTEISTSFSLFHNFSLEKYKVGGMRAARESVHCRTSAN